MILFFDCETASLNPATTQILEVAVIVTDDNLVELDRYQALIKPGSVDRLWANMEPFVRQMHDDSGLRQALDLAPLSSLSDVEWDLLALIDRCVGPVEKVTLGGMGVSHFDHLVIDHQMDMLARRLTYWDYDCSVVRRFFKLAGDDSEWPHVEPQHRAMADVETAIWHAKTIKHRMDWMIRRHPAGA